MTGGRGPDAWINAVGMEAQLLTWLSYIEQGQLDPSFLATHPMPLKDAVAGYDLFKRKTDNCLQAVFTP